MKLGTHAPFIIMTNFQIVTLFGYNHWCRKHFKCTVCSTPGKPGFRDYKCHFTIPAKLTIFATFGRLLLHNI